MDFSISSHCKQFQGHFSQHRLHEVRHTPLLGGGLLLQGHQKKHWKKNNATVQNRNRSMSSGVHLICFPKGWQWSTAPSYIYFWQQFPISCSLTLDLLFVTKMNNLNNLCSRSLKKLPKVVGEMGMEGGQHMRHFQWRGGGFYKFEWESASADETRTQ